MSEAGAVDELRGQLVLDHARAPVGRSLEGEPRAGERQARGYTPSCGDEVLVRVAVDGDRVTGLVWTGHGCQLSQASASMLAALVAEAAPLPVEELRRSAEVLQAGAAAAAPAAASLGDADALTGGWLTPQRQRCAVLAWAAAAEALGEARSG